MGAENDIFWSDKRSGFKEPGCTLNSQYLLVPRQEAGRNGNWKEVKKGKCVPVETAKQSVFSCIQVRANSQTKGLERG